MFFLIARTQSVTSLHQGICKSTLEALVDFIYSGLITLSRENVQVKTSTFRSGALIKRNRKLNSKNITFRFWPLLENMLGPK